MTSIQILFIFLFIISTFGFFITLTKRKFVAAYCFFLTTLPVSIKLPLFITTMDNYDMRFRVIEGVSFITIYQLIFLKFLFKNNTFRRYFKYLKKQKFLLLILVSAISLSVSQFLNTELGVKSLLLGLTEIIDPFIFSIISGFIFLKVNFDLRKICRILNYLLLFYLFFNILNGLFLREVAGNLRVSGGATGNATLAGTIFATVSILNVYLFIQNPVKKNIQYLFFGVVFLVLLFFTKTRGALLGMVFSYLYIFYKSRHSIKKRIINIFLPLLALVIPVIIDLYSTRNNTLSDNSIEDRFIRNAIAFDTIIEDFFIGIGFANPKFNMLNPGDPLLEVHYHVYNTFLAWATYGGVLAGIGFILIFFKSFIKPKRIGILIVANSVLILWFVDFNTTGNMLLFSGYPYSGIIFFFLCIGFNLSLKYKYETI